LSQFPIESLGWASGRPVGILTLADIPGAETEFITIAFGHNCQSDASGKAAGRKQENLQATILVYPAM